MQIREAVFNDLSFIVEMLADDPIAAKREAYGDPLPESYKTAFELIKKDPLHLLMVAEEEGKVIGTFQLSFLPYLTYQGRMRAQIEAVRIHKAHRSIGLGQQFFEWAIAKSKDKGCHVLQLTTDKQRPDAFRFYEKLGFKASHEGMKLHF
ncbi:MAG: GNAT superfamily N-acetyltransferase [Limisphaerales bacterium]|jgi:GNAT superfamily N-acetyltransferase